MTNQTPQSGSAHFIELGGRFFNMEEIREIQPHGYTMNFLAQSNRYRASVSILRKDNSSTIVDLKDGFDNAQSALDFATEIVRKVCGSGK
jgi:hypothetical protein